MLTNLNAKILLLIFCFAITKISRSQNITYVTPTGAGNMDGSSWNNALRGDDLRSAIRAAPANTTFWIAAGTYKPHPTSRDSSFFIYHKRIDLYGGFNGSETSISQRDLISNQTILSGAVHPTDSAQYSDVIIRYENADSSVLDGFVLRDAHGQSALLNQSQVYESAESRVFVRNCLFRNNKSIFNSQAAAFINPFAGHAMLHFFNCDFFENYNGAIGMRHGTEYFANSSTIVADSCRFFGNTGNVVVLGGANRTNNSASIRLSRCEFQNNHQIQTGAIIMFWPSTYLGQTVPEGVVSLQLDSCYFGNNNVATTIFYNPNMADSSRLLMNNCVIDSNGLSDPTLPYGHGNTAILTSSRTRINKNYILNTRINNSSAYFHPAQGSTVSITSERPGTDSTFIYNVLFNNCQNMHTNIAHQAFNGRHSTVYLVNSTLFKNEVSTQNGWRMILNQGINTTGTGAVTHFYIQNSIIWPSTKHWGNINMPKLLINNSEEYAEPGNTKLYLQNSIINAFADGGSLSNMGIDLGGNILQEPVFKDSLAGNFQLVCSTGIDQGNDALYNTSLGGMVDLNQRDRFNGTIDIGAFEYYPDSVTVNISGPSAACSGQQVTFTATADNAGNSPQFEWFVNGAPVGTGNNFATTSLNNDDLISVIVTSSIHCIEKNKDTAYLPITILPPGASPEVQLTASPLPVCAGSNITFTAFTNLQQPVYQWFVNGNSTGSNSNTYISNTLQNGDEVSVMVSGDHATCTGSAPVQLQSDVITISLNQPVVPTVQISANPDGDVLPFTIAVINPIPGWVYTLYRNNINTTLTGTIFQNLQDTGAYQVRASGSGCYTDSNAVSNVIIKNAIPSPDIFTTLILHPVPVKDALTVSGITADMNLRYCKIFDAKGRLVHSQNIEGNTGLVINRFSNFPAGTYVVCFFDNSGDTKSYKVVKLN